MLHEALYFRATILAFKKGISMASSTYVPESKTPIARPLVMPPSPVDFYRPIINTVPPLEVKHEDIYENGLLLPDNVIQAIEAELEDLPDNKYSKDLIRKMLAEYGFSDELLKYAIIKKDNALYIVYKGLTWSAKENNRKPGDEKIATGFLADKESEVTTKIVVEIKTKKWCIDKITLLNRKLTSEGEARLARGGLIMMDQSKEEQILEKLRVLDFSNGYISKKKGIQSHAIMPYSYHFNLKDFTTNKKLYRNKGVVLRFLYSAAENFREFHQSKWKHLDITPENFKRVPLSKMGLGLAGLASLSDLSNEVKPSTKADSSSTEYAQLQDVRSFIERVNAVMAPYQNEQRSCWGFASFWDDWYNTVIKDSLEKEKPDLDTFIRTLKNFARRYPLDNSITKVDIKDFFAATNKEKFMAKLEKLTGSICITDTKGPHSLHQHYTFQQVLCEAGIRIDEHVIPPVPEIAPIDKISNSERKRVIAILNLESKEEGIEKLKKELANDAIKTYPQLIARLKTEATPRAEAKYAPPTLFLPTFPETPIQSLIVELNRARERRALNYPSADLRIRY